ncbi:MAG: adenylate/guanylate cyclase domain-containing protein [Chloroflexota bacterium]|nr:MAG: adenylate/guanylate cyclase domain-containing protein [Chloroflexota bacterium]
MGASRSDDSGSRPGPPVLTGEQLAAISRFPDQNPNPVLRMTRDGRLQYANAASAGVMASMAAAVGAPMAGAWHSRIQAAAGSGQPFEVAVGSATFEILAVDVPELGFVNLYGTDVTARKAVARFPDQNPNPVFRLDWDGRIVYANAASAGLIDGIGSAVGGTIEADLWARLKARVEATERAVVEVSAGGRTYALLPVDVPEFGFVNVYGTDITAAKELERLHRENERLLLNILPEPIADRLRRGERLIADRFDDVTLLFADIVGFTELSSAMQPDELVEVLNEVFSVFDDLVEEHGLEKVKTIGDAYMVVGGLTDAIVDHPERVARMAIALAARVAEIDAARLFGIRFRVGMNCGPVVAGVIGTKKFIYDIWGDTVNLASRMESTGVPGRVQVSGAVEERLRGRFRMAPRGLVEVKGKGFMPTWFLEAEEGPPGVDQGSRSGSPSRSRSSHQRRTTASSS